MSFRGQNEQAGRQGRNWGPGSNGGLCAETQLSSQYQLLDTQMSSAWTRDDYMQKYFGTDGSTAGSEIPKDHLGRNGSTTGSENP